MSDAARALASYRRSMARVGEEIAVRRFSGPPASRISVDTTVRARITGYEPHEIAGPVVIGDRKVICLVDTLASLLPLTTADRLVIRGKETAIKKVDDSTRRVGGTLIALEIQVGG